MGTVVLRTNGNIDKIEDVFERYLDIQELDVMRAAGSHSQALPVFDHFDARALRWNDEGTDTLRCFIGACPDKEMRQAECAGNETLAP